MIIGHVLQLFNPILFKKKEKMNYTKIYAVCIKDKTSVPE